MGGRNNEWVENQKLNENTDNISLSPIYLFSPTNLFGSQEAVQVNDALAVILHCATVTQIETPERIVCMHRHRPQQRVLTRGLRAHEAGDEAGEVGP